MENNTSYSMISYSHTQPFQHPEQHPPQTTSDEGTTLEYLHNCAPFVAKLYSLINSPETNALIGWSEAYKGTAILINDSITFSHEILPKHFKHSNIASFVRQLNIYGFHKVDNKEGLCFKHEFFQRDHPELLQKIKRKKNKKDILSPQQQAKEIIDVIKQEETDPFLNVASLRLDLGKVQNQVEEIKNELQDGKMKWALLSRRIDQLDQLFNMLYSNFSGMQANTQMQNIGYSSAAALYQNQRRQNDVPDESHHTL
ncbi:heat stress transcription factor A-6B, putative [Entamoeba invadens IP1]|uniref:Heat stress transcription factor A-6B, putative n=1 Tax=Entamoeba invadens IP1 TaxID=370355 RepID=A0A0A1UFL9_ENTIV|nr:heat stress transcription factor A-6B, putative [Entamoeba invadens IP1]ELP92754.1 heat stress transcription factor A-6B, putative [Entamoeba invadens IP1]|eukprot:XP_004259525.1 heat stress transcription factor A-6B, putative [Entamoeba invadens IP1]